MANKFCMNCGNPLDEGDTFCGKCGAKVEDLESALERENGGIAFAQGKNVAASTQNQGGVTPLFTYPELKEKPKKDHSTLALIMTIVAALLVVAGVYFFYARKRILASGAREATKASIQKMLNLDITGLAKDAKAVPVAAYDKGLKAMEKAVPGNLFGVSSSLKSEYNGKKIKGYVDDGIDELLEDEEAMNSIELPEDWQDRIQIEVGKAELLTSADQLLEHVDLMAKDATNAAVKLNKKGGDEDDVNYALDELNDLGDSKYLDLFKEPIDTFIKNADRLALVELKITVDDVSIRAFDICFCSEGKWYSGIGTVGAGVFAPEMIIYLHKSQMAKDCVRGNVYYRQVNYVMKEESLANAIRNTKTGDTDQWFAYALPGEGFQSPYPGMDSVMKEINENIGGKTDEFSYKPDQQQVWYLKLEGDEITVYTGTGEGAENEVAPKTSGLYGR